MADTNISADFALATIDHSANKKAKDGAAVARMKKTNLRANIVQFKALKSH